MATLDDILDRKPAEKQQSAKPLVDWGSASAQPQFTPPVLQQQTNQGKVTSPLPAAGGAAVQPQPQQPDEPKKSLTPSQLLNPNNTPLTSTKEAEAPKSKLSANPRLSYADIFKLTNSAPTQEELEKEKKREKRQKMWASISDGISALSSLYFTTKGAPNMYDPKNSLSEKAKERWDKLDKERDAKSRAYSAGLLNAMKADDDNDEKQRKWLRLLGLDEYNRGKDQAAQTYKEERDKVKDGQFDKGYEQKEKFFNTTTDLKKDAQKEAVRAHKASESLAGERNEETKRHNGVSEANAANKGNGSKSGKNSGNNTVRLHDGSVHSYKVDKQGAITSLAPAMQKKAKEAAERYSASGDYKSASRYRGIATALQSAKSKDAMSAIVIANVGDFPSMDKDIRKIIDNPAPAAKAPAKPATTPPKAPTKGKSYENTKKLAQKLGL